MCNDISNTCKNGTDLWKTWTNIKGLLSYAGHQGRSGESFKLFSPCKIVTFIEIMILNGLSQVFNLDVNLKIDPVAVNDLCARI